MNYRICYRILLVVLFLMTFSCTASVNSEPKIVIINLSTMLDITKMNNSCFIGDSLLNNKASGSFEIKNIGLTDLIIGNVSISGADAEDFNITKFPDETVRSRQITLFTIEFKPTVKKRYSALVTVENNDPNNSFYEFEITGEVVDSAFQVYDSHSNRISDGTGEYTFTPVEINKVSTETFEIRNLGSEIITLTGWPYISVFRLDIDYFVVTQIPSETILPGESTSFMITFSPTESKQYGADALIRNSDPDAGNYTFSLKGQGLKPGIEINVRQDRSNISSPDGEFYFDFVDIGLTKQKTFTIENFGSKELMLTGSPIITILGSSKTHYNLNIDDTDSSIAPGGSTTFTIEFAPKSKGPKIATITILNNDDDENPYTFEVKGFCGKKLVSDFNGDGFQDVLISAPHDEVSGIRPGSVYMFFGRQNITSFNLNLAMADVKFVGEDYDGNQFGASVSSAGDINRDGYQDIIVGAPRGSVLNARCGVAYIFFGRQIWSEKISAKDADIIITGASANDYFGNCVSAAGDINADGIDDFIVGAYSYHSPVDSRLGCAYLFFGKLQWSSNLLESDADVKIIGNNHEDYFGYSVACAGDINSDGMHDIIVGANFDDDNGRDSGSAFIFFGREDWNGVSLAAQADVKLVGMDIRDRFGNSVACASDVNCDGCDDIIIGAPRADVGGFDSGCAYVFFGMKTWDSVLNANDADVTIVSFNMDTMLGFSVSSAGDINKDGKDDIIIGSNNYYSMNEGKAYVLFGRDSWNSIIYETSVDVTFSGYEPNDCFGYSVSSAGDIDNDGFDDVIIGACYRQSYYECGRVCIFSGRDSWSKDYQTSDADIELVGEDDYDELGLCVSGNK